MSDILSQIEELDNFEITQTNNLPDTKKSKTIEEVKQLAKTDEAKEKILDYVLELLETPLSPKDLKDLTDIIQKLEGKSQDTGPSINILVQNLIAKFEDDV